MRVVATLAAAALAGCLGAPRRPDPPPQPPPAKHGLDGLELAVILAPMAREAIVYMDMVTATASINPGVRIDSRAAIRAYEDMLREHFKSVTMISRPKVAAPGRFHLVCELDLHIEIGSMSGSRTESEAIASFLGPDQAEVEKITVEAGRVVPYPAVKNMFAEANLEARDLLEKAILGSSKLAAFARASAQRAAKSQPMSPLRLDRSKGAPSSSSRSGPGL